MAGARQLQSPNTGKENHMQQTTLLPAEQRDTKGSGTLSWHEGWRWRMMMMGRTGPSMCRSRKYIVSRVWRLVSFVMGGSSMTFGTIAGSTRGLNFRQIDDTAMDAPKIHGVVLEIWHWHWRFGEFSHQLLEAASKLCLSFGGTETIWQGKCDGLEVHGGAGWLIDECKQVRLRNWQETRMRQGLQNKSDISH